MRVCVRGHPCPRVRLSVSPPALRPCPGAPSAFAICVRARGGGWRRGRGRALLRHLCGRVHGAPPLECSYLYAHVQREAERDRLDAALTDARGALAEAEEREASARAAAAAVGAELEESRRAHTAVDAELEELQRMHAALSAELQQALAALAQVSACLRVCVSAPLSMLCVCRSKGGSRPVKCVVLVVRLCWRCVCVGGLSRMSTSAPPTQTHHQHAHALAHAHAHAHTRLHRRKARWRRWRRCG